jgi:hypothetical protein
VYIPPEDGPWGPKHVVAIDSTFKKCRLEEMLDVSFSFLTISYIRKVCDYFFPEILVIIEKHVVVMIECYFAMLP